MSSRYTEAVRGRIVTLETPAITIDLSAPPPSLYIFSRLGARLVTRSNASRQNSILLCVHVQETFIINLDRDPFALDLLPPPSSFSSLVSLTPWLEIEFWKNSWSRSKKEREREKFFHSFANDVRCASHASCLCTLQWEEKNDWDRTSW